MALWQFTVMLLPQEKVLRIYPSIPTQMSWEEYESVDWNLDDSFEKLEEEISSTLHKNQCPLIKGSGWSECLTQWGKEDDDVIKLWHESEEYRSDISAR